MKKVIFLILIILSSYFLYKYFFQSIDSKIEKKISFIEKRSQITAERNQLEIISRAKSILSEFRNPFLVDSELHNYNSQVDEELALRQMLAFERMVETLEVNLEIESIKIEDLEVIVNVKISAYGKFTGNRGEFFDMHLVELVFDKENLEIIKVFYKENLRYAYRDIRVRGSINTGIY